MPGSNDSRWFTQPWLVGAFVIVALLVVKADALTEPPAWDAAMSVHPAALTLADNGFNYAALLDSPRYDDGGPNTHSLSVYTSVVAVTYWLLPSQTAIVVLHVLTFSLAALMVVGIVRLAGHFLPPGFALAGGLIALSVPVVLTQAGMVYLEFPVLAASTWAMVAAVEQRWRGAAAYCLVATMVKPSGLIIAAAIGAFWYSSYRTALPALLIVIPSALVGLLEPMVAPSLSLPSIATAGAVGRASWGYFVSVPDLGGYMLAAIAGGLWLSRTGRRKDDQRLARLWVWVLIAFIGFYSTLSSVAFTTLPRYYILIVPLALITVFVAVHRRFGPTALSLLMAALALVSAVNFNGDLYPLNDINNFALIERSDAYDDLLTMEIAAARAICQLPAEAPVLFSRPEHYRLTYPEMGYADCPDRAAAEPLQFSELSLNELQSSTTVTFEHPWLGGESLRALVAAARDSSDWLVQTIDTIQVGKYRQDIYLLSRN